jgi:hypothetical protein
LIFFAAASFWIHVHNAMRLIAAGGNLVLTAVVSISPTARLRSSSLVTFEGLLGSVTCLTDQPVLPRDRTIRHPCRLGQPTPAVSNGRVATVALSALRGRPWTSAD